MPSAFEEYKAALSRASGGGGGRSIPGVYQPATPGSTEEWMSPSGLHGGTRMTEGTQEQFDPQAAFDQYGAPRTSPSGAVTPTSSFDVFSKFIKDQYGMSPQDFLEADPEARYESWARPRGVATSIEEIPTNEAGMPERPPKSPEEAALFQFLAGERTREKNESMMANAIATIQHAIGLLRRGGKGALAVSQSPMLSQLADVYRTTQFEEPDYSYWLLPEARTGV